MDSQVKKARSKPFSAVLLLSIIFSLLLTLFPIYMLQSKTLEQIEFSLILCLVIGVIWLIANLVFIFSPPKIEISDYGLIYRGSGNFRSAKISWENIKAITIFRTPAVSTSILNNSYYVIKKDKSIFSFSDSLLEFDYKALLAECKKRGIEVHIDPKLQK